MIITVVFLWSCGFEMSVICSVLWDQVRGQETLHNQEVNKERSEDFEACSYIPH